MKTKTKYTEEPMGDLRIVKDFLPPPIWLLTLYSKNEKATIPSHILKKIAEEIKNA